MFKRKLLRCSFCGKDENQVAKLVAGPHVYVCDACVGEAKRIMDASPSPDDPGNGKASLTPVLHPH